MSINIPRDVIDIFYRYKRPAIKTITIRKHGGCTQITNLDKVAQSIGVTDTLLVKILKQRLNCQLIMIDNYPTLKKMISASDIDDVIEVFINEYVLCDECHNPEFIETIEKKRVVHLCKACGHTRKVSINK